MLKQESKKQWCKFLSGDEKAYTWIYKTFIQDLYRYGLRFTVDTELVKDCIQEVFTSIYKNRQRLSTPENVKVYLFVSMKNSILRLLQKEISYNQLESDIVSFSLEPTVEDQFIAYEEYNLRQEYVKEMLSLLSSRQQEIIYYRYIQEMSFDEICLLMNLNYQSAQNLIQRSLKKLRDAYGTIPYSFFFLLSLLGGNIKSI
ncbi:sigma-70 family RNA polymerase sigma factor [Parabacteroides sp. 52]|uniref:RNA polymerase sigma factor n=1 Tax=unclassified Parabacteroides TaxID=2649774 RepID=UPI0013D46470|nr:MULTISPECIES: sigma-70 family RNA polymerase sigma factor [unclassified Parabacteroides]MDH6535226.1 RNA polymerase sigma factor (sigma-70 family) [Parabacteroides sp. PM5-20]NDV55634.1 sigma-70 family RNA polymerase sigma factor [Parabacteroides sp. 52]